MKAIVAISSFFILIGIVVLLKLRADDYQKFADELGGNFNKLSRGLIKGELEGYEYTFSSVPRDEFSPSYIKISMFFHFPSDLSISLKENKDNALKNKEKGKKENHQIGFVDKFLIKDSDNVFTQKYLNILVRETIEELFSLGVSDMFFIKNKGVNILMMGTCIDNVTADQIKAILSKLVKLAKAL